MYRNAILVSLLPDGDHFVSITTVSRQHPRRTRFLMLRDTVADLITGDKGHLYDTDLNNFIDICRADRDTVHVRISWLHTVYGDQLEGYKEMFDLPLSVLRDAVHGKPVRCIADNTITQCPVTLAPSAQKLVAKLTGAERSALRKALRDSFYWSYPEQITLYADWDRSFLFTSSCITGGVCRHKSTVIGKDGKERERVTYSIHT